MTPNQYRGPGALLRKFYDDPAFQQVAFEATRRANVTGERMRIFRAYNQYCLRFATSDYQGVHVAFVEPDTKGQV